MIHSKSIGVYITLLIVTIVVFSGAVIGFLYTQNRSLLANENRLNGYHNATIISCTEMESELLHLQDNLLLASSSIVSSPRKGAINLEGTRQLLFDDMNIISSLQAKFNQPAFDPMTARLLVAHENFDNHLQDFPHPLNLSFIASFEFRDLAVRLTQLSRSHEGASEKLAVNIESERNRAFTNFIIFTLAMIGVAALLIARILFIIRHLLKDQRDSEERIRSILDAASEPIITMDTAGFIQTFNKAAEHVFGYEQEIIIGQRLPVLLPDSHPLQFNELVESGSDPGMSGIHSLVGVRSDGNHFPVEYSISKLILEDTQLYIAVLQDITRRQELEEQLRQSQKMEAIGHLAGGMAHDFNNLLHVIMGNADLILLETSKSDPKHNLVTTIISASEQGKELIQQVLTFSRREFVQPQILCMNTQVQESITMLRRLIPSTISLEINLQDDIKLVKADNTQVSQILLNLTLNSRDAMPDGGIFTLETSEVCLDSSFVEEHDDLESGMYIKLSVSDSGCGISPEDQSHVFEPFFTTKEVGAGTGLGLSTIYGIVKQSRGTIEMISKEKQGTTFNIYFPVVSSMSDSQQMA